MNPTKTRRIALLCCLGILALCFESYAQVTAGIKANGRVMVHGDTINVCRGNTITYESVAQGSSTINWRFNTGTPGTMTGAGPFNITYNINGFDTSFQKVGTGAFADSMFIIVRVFDDKPIAGFNFLPDNVCGNETIQFTNTSTIGEPFWYRWDFGDGSMSIEQDPTHQFLSAVGSGTQTFPVKLIVTNSNTCVDSISHTVTIRSVPDAAIGNADPMVTVGEYKDTISFRTCNDEAFYNFKFTNQSTTLAGNVSYHINWGDGTPDTVFASWPAGDIINHNFPSGSSTMTVSVTGLSGCIGIKKYIVYVGIFPGGGLTGPADTEICEGDSLTFNFTNTSPNSPGTSYLFYVNDGTESQVFRHPVQPTVGHRFNKNSCANLSDGGAQIFNNSFGAYLLIQNPCGVASASVVPIYVSGKPKPAINLSDSTVCVNNTVNIINTSSFGKVITPAGGGNASCEDKGKNVWTISPATGFTISSGTLGSLNGNVLNQDAWTDGNDSLNVQFQVPGTYTIKIYVGNERCGMDSTVSSICVRSAPQASFTMSQQSSCGPVTLGLTNISPVNECNPADDEYLWVVDYTDTAGCAVVGDPTWTFVNGSNETTKSPSLSLTAAGRYIIQLTVKATHSGSSCADVTISDTFYVKGPLKVEMAALPTVCVNNIVNPSASISSCYSPGPFGYQWSFTNGNPAVSNDSLPGAVFFITDGNQAVQLIVTDSSCMQADTVNTSVTVLPLPAVVVANDTTICSGETVALGGAAVAGVTYQWSPAAGLSDPASADPVATLNYNGPANDTIYTYYLVAKQGSDCTQTDSVKIIVKQKPVVTITPVSAAICAGSSTLLDAGGADSYEWAPNTTLDNPTASTVAARPSTTTTYTVTGTLTNGCAGKQSVVVNVYETPVAGFDLVPVKLCTGQSVTVTNNSSNATEYEWIWDDGTNSSFDNGQHLYNTAGTYNVRLIARRVDVSGVVCTDTMTTRIEVVDKIVANINVGSEAKCAPYSLNVNAGNLTGASLIEWVIYDSSAAPGEFYSTGSSASYVYQKAGSYAVRLVVHSAAGCTDTTFYEFEVFSTPLTTLEPVLVNLCSNDTTINFTAQTQADGDGTISYKWYINNNLEGTVNPFTYHFVRPPGNTVPGEFIVRLETQSGSGCGQSSVSGKVILQPPPTASIQVSPSLVQQQPNDEFTFKDLAPADPGKTYTWFMGNSTETREGHQITYKYRDTGTYHVKLLVKDLVTGCTVEDSVKVTILHVPGYVQVPNAICPGCSNYSVRRFLPVAKGLKSYRLRIYTTWGQKIFETTSLDVHGSPNVAWDGTLNGKPLQQDVYSWQIEGTFKNGTEWKGMLYPGSNKPVKAGFITVIK